MNKSRIESVFDMQVGLGSSLESTAGPSISCSWVSNCPDAFFSDRPNFYLFLRLEGPDAVIRILGPWNLRDSDDFMF